MERAIYDILTHLDGILTNSGLVESVSFGDIDEVALKKTTIYPLAHVTLNPSSFNGKLTTLNLSIICMDIVAQNKTEGTIYEKNNNEIDVLNSMHALCGYILEKFPSHDLSGLTYLDIIRNVNA